MTDECSGVSWELTEVALRRLHEENGDDIMGSKSWRLARVRKVHNPA